MTTKDHTAALRETVLKAMNRAWHLGQTYFQQADSESYSQNRKSEDTRAKFLALVDEVATLLESAQPQQPAGWKLVPVEPTPEMLEAGRDAGDFHIMHYDGADKPGTPRYSLGRSYAAMLDAAPAHPSQQEDDERGTREKLAYIQRYSESHDEGGGVYEDEDGDFVRLSDVIAAIADSAGEGGK